MASKLGTIGNIDTLVLNGRTFTDMSNLIALCAYSVGGPHFATLRKQSGTAGYQVTAGKTMKIFAAKIFGQNATTSDPACTPAYGDNDVGQDTGSTPTNVVYFGGDSSMAIGAQTSKYEDVAIDFNIPATKYAAQRTATRIWSLWYAYEF